MGLDIQQNKTKVVRLVPSSPMSSPTCSIQDREGTELATPTPTVSTVNTTVASDATNTAQYFKLTSATGLSAGDTIRITDATWGTADAVVSSVDGSFVRLVEPLPGEPDATSAVRGLDVLVTVPTTATEDLALDNIVIVTEGQEEITELFNVVAHVYRGPCTARDVRDYMSRIYSGEPLTDEQWFTRVAAEVNRNIRGRLLESTAYVARYWDPDTLREIGRIMMRLVLADYGYWTGDGDREDHLRSLRFELKERVAGVLKGGHAYDADGDGGIDDDEVDGSTTIRGER